MRLLPSDPDIETLVGRIDSNDIDLQPDFQRGEVWSQSKRQRLIDSILRDWHVPPIHVIQNDDQTVSVLDGQQRLAAIRDFVAGVIRVDGALPPLDSRISQLDGMSFKDLPGEVRRRFLRFSIRVFTIVDYRPAEPGELFYRLNQLSSLTAAEQRNAFFGDTRKQVKQLTQLVAQMESGSGIFGFSNARMAYDDVIARALFLIEAGTLRQKITSLSLADRYRNNQPFSTKSVKGVKNALKLMAVAQRIARGGVKLNKATALTWLVFLASAPESFDDSVFDVNLLAEFMARFEIRRQSEKLDHWAAMSTNANIRAAPEVIRQLFLRGALYEYEDRATSRVADVSSVVLRDLVLWIFFLSDELPQHIAPLNPIKRMLAHVVENLGDFIEAQSLEELAEKLEWGAVL